MTRYVITRSRSRGDVGLSRPAHWGGMRFDDVDAAKAWITSQVRRQSVFYGFGTAEIVVEDGL